jgi:hypothetical protein
MSFHHATVPDYKIPTPHPSEFMTIIMTGGFAIAIEREEFSSLAMLDIHFFFREREIGN